MTTHQRIPSLKNLRQMIPPWILIGSVLVLVPIFTFMAVSHIQRQKEIGIHLLEEKGAALIRSFEAGTRTGMMGMPQSGFRLQRLLAETAEQPDIVYLFVTDTQGRVLAHSEPTKIGTTVPTGLDLSAVATSSTLQWRQVEPSNGPPVFEVYRRFEPTGPMRMGKHRFVDRFHGHRLPSDIETHMGKQPLEAVIFVGLSMDPVEAARKADTQHTVFMALILLLIGFAGIILLFFGVRYQEARSSLSRIRAFSDTVVASMPMGLVAVDMAARIIAVNPMGAALLGLDAHRVVGRDEKQVLPPTLCTLTQTVREQGEVVDVEIECPVSSGRRLPLQVSGRTLREEPGADPVGCVLLFKDLSEINELRREIIRNQRLSSIGRLAGGVAHEIRNPLSSIKGFAVYFKERYRQVPEDQQIAEIMIQEVERLNRVVSQLVDFSRPLGIARQSVDIGELVSSSLKLIQRQANDKSIQIKTAFSPGLPKPLLDRDRMSQVLLNLYLNAIEAMSSGGKLSISAHPSMEDDAILLEIHDTGGGIASEALGQVFDPYFTTKPSGTGLGLAIVHNIVEAHEGKIRIQSREGNGTTVTIRLPSPSQPPSGPPAST